MSTNLTDHPQAESLPLNSLVPNPNNARTHTAKQVRQIATSIERFGFLVPIIADDSNNIVAGHGRFDASRKLGLTSVPVIRVKFLSDADRRAFALAENRIAELSGWDEDLLSSELSFLLEDGYPLEITGFTLADMNFAVDPVPETLGRFLQADPVGYQGGANLYAYAQNDPIGFIDDAGHGPWGWLARLTKGGIELTKPLWTKRATVNARKKGENVYVPRRQRAGETQRAAAKDPNNVLHHGGHDLGDGKTGSPHFQEKGVKGHTYHGPLSVVLTGVITALEVIEQLDPLYVQETTACDTITSGCGGRQGTGIKQPGAPGHGKSKEGEAPAQDSGLQAPLPEECRGTRLGINDGSIC